MMCTWKLRTTSFQIMTENVPNEAPIIVFVAIRPASGMRCQMPVDDALNDRKETKSSIAPSVRYTAPLPCTRAASLPRAARVKRLRTCSEHAALLGPVREALCKRGAPQLAGSAAGARAAVRALPTTSAALA
jgi:hypothetical protein